MNRPPHNNGKHPARDTLLVNFLQRLGWAGDAWRYAAKLRRTIYTEIELQFMTSNFAYS